MSTEYDFVIIGAGPSGLTLAYTLSYLDYSVVLIEREKTIGGCHRVNRVNGLFSEHGPRVYSDAYVNTRNILKHMGLDFYDLFNPYDPDKWSFFRLKPRELAVCAFEYAKLVINQDYGKDKSVEWLTKNFSKESRDFIDRLCRMTDGAGSDRYTVHQFLNLFNQNMLHGVYIPKEPNDVGLFSKWKLSNISTASGRLSDTKLLLGQTIKEFRTEGDKIKSVVLKLDNNSSTSEGTIINGKNFLLCIPPQSLVELIKNTPLQNAFGDYSNLLSWSITTGYNSYIPIAYHWDAELNLPKKWGFPAMDWGIAFIIMSRYMKFNDSRSQTVISTCIMYTDRPSSLTGKTANQSTKDELIAEVFRQLGVALDTQLPKYTFAVPNTIEKYDNSWHDKDKAFVVSANGRFLKNKSHVFKNLYSVGTHNGNSNYSFTTFESALTNALHTLHEIAPESGDHFNIVSPVSLDTFIRLFLLLLITFVIYKILY